MKEKTKKEILELEIRKLELEIKLAEIKKENNIKRINIPMRNKGEHFLKLTTHPKWKK